MSAATYYFQPCPVCGRALEIRVDWLGKELSCQHCHGRFTAADPTRDSRDSIGDGARSEESNLAPPLLVTSPQN